MPSSFEWSSGSEVTNSLSFSTRPSPCSLWRNFSWRRELIMKRADSRTASAAPSPVDRFDSRAMRESAERTAPAAPPCPSAPPASSCESTAEKRSPSSARCNSCASGASTGSAPLERGEPVRLTFISLTSGGRAARAVSGPDALGRAEQVGRVEQCARRAAVRGVCVRRDDRAKFGLGLFAAALEEQRLGAGYAGVEAFGPAADGLVARFERPFEAAALQLDRAERHARHVRVGQDFHHPAEDGLRVVKLPGLAQNEAGLHHDAELCVRGRHLT